MPHLIRPRRIPWHLFLIFLLLSLGILGIGSLYHDHEQAYLKQEKLDELKVIADLKVKQIVQWRRDRFADATLIMKASYLIARINHWLPSQDRPELKGEILHRLKALMDNQYQNIVLLDPAGRVRLSVLAEEPALTSPDQELAREAMQTRRVIFSDLHQIPGSQDLRFSIVVPLFISQGIHATPVGAILMWIDPHQFFFPLIQGWPTHSRSGETVLLRREGDAAVVLNELRHRPGAALTLRFPLQEPKLPAAMTARGAHGAIEGVDYRGVPVVAVVGSIPDSPWYFVTKIDTAEVYAPLRGLFRMSLLFIIVFISGAGVSLALIWSNQQRRFFRRQYEMEREREEEVSRHAAMVQDLYNNAPCGYHSLDREGTFVQINDTELTWLGYTREEVAGKMKFSDLLTTAGRDLFQHNFLSFQRRGWVRDLEFDLIRQDGTRLPVLLSSTAIKDEAGNYLMSRSTVYDISARVQAAAALESERQRLFQVLEQLPAYVVLLAPDYTVTYANREFTRRFGVAAEGQRCYEFRFGRDKPCEPCQTFKVLETKARREWEWSGPDGRTYAIFDYPFTDVDGSPLILELGLDITVRKQAEEAVRRSEALLRTIMETLPVGVWVCDQDGRITLVNPAAQKIWGGAEYLGRDQYGQYKGWRADTGESIKPEAWALTRAIRKGETTLNEIVEIESFDGTRKFLLNSAVPIFGADQSITAAIMVHQDITGLKAAEEKIIRINRLYAVLSKINKAVVRLHDPRQLYQEACRILVQEGGFRMAWIGLRDSASLQLKPVACEGVEEGYLEKITVTSQDTQEVAGPTGTAVREGRHDICTDFARDPRMAPWREEALMRGYRSSMALPLQQDAKVLGALTVYADKPEFFKDEEIELMAFMADDLSFAMKSMDLEEKRRRAEASLAKSERKLRHLTAQLMTAHEQERSRVSKEIHDDLGQSLLVLKMQLRAIQRKLGAGEPECKEEIGASLNFLNEVIESVRRLSRNLSPLILEGLGLNEALQNLFDEFAKHYGNSDFLVHLDMVEALIPQEKQISIYRIFQEALTNIAKYAHPTRVKVDMKKKARAVSFRIEDNGAGFDPEEVMSRKAPEKGMGLATMSERVKMLGGTFHISSKKGQGTTITFSLPLDQEEIT